MSGVDPVPALVSTDWLAARLGSKDRVLADVRWYLPMTGRRGRAEYERGHLPGAVFLDVDADLSRPPGEGPGRHPLPEPEAFARALSAVGIGETSHVVAYDDTGGSTAARLWWLVRYFGHPRVSVLDGGIPRWVAEGRPITTETPRPAPACFVARPDPSRVVGRREVERLAADPAALVLDARAPERYEGRSEPVDARPGHIPGARNAPWAANLRREEAPRLLPPEELRERYRALGAGEARPVVCYCGSGVTACHDLLALHLAGLPDALLYEGSWSEWAGDPSLPAATGEEP